MEKENYKNEYIMENIEIECPECGCKQIFMKKKKLNKFAIVIGSALALIPHPIAKLAGFTSAFIFNIRWGKIQCTCPKCNNVWYPSELNNNEPQDKDK